MVLLGLLLNACGGGSSSPTTGTLTLAITDDSIDDYQEALLVVSSITLIGSGGQETDDLLDTPQEIDLLKLRNVSELLLRETLTARTISKIRLGVDSITLVKRDVDGGFISQVEPAVPTRKIDLNPQGPLEIRAGEDLIVTIDVDLHNSIKVNETGNGEVRFRPVILLSAGSSGLVRLYGTYTEDVNNPDEPPSICMLERISDMSPSSDPLDVCIALDESRANYFNEDAQPIMSVDDGNTVSVYGFYEQGSSGEVLAAEIIAREVRGETFTTYNGLVATPWNDAEPNFDLNVIAADLSAEIPVTFSEGAKIFDVNDAIVTPEDVSEPSDMNITPGVRAEVRGAANGSGPDLQAFVGFVDGMESVTSGEIGMKVDDLAPVRRLTIMLVPDSVIPEDAASCVSTTSLTRYYSLDTTVDITEVVEIDFEDLESGDMISASGDVPRDGDGEPTSDCVQANTIVRERML
jgi:hypothetical protein